jgi:hypothetical protein
MDHGLDLVNVVAFGVGEYEGCVCNVDEVDLVA